MDPASSARDFSELQKPLEQFRARTRRPRIHPLEIILLWIVATHLLLLPWALGGMRLWAQLPALALSALALAVALIPRNYTEEFTGTGDFRLVMWPKLLRFPLFWLGLALLGYITLQAANPAWVYHTDGTGWSMRAIPHRSWLPAGVSAPFARWGPWRLLLVYVPAWLTVCAIWIGFTRRRTLQWLMIAIAANGVALAGFGVLQQMLSNGKMFWFWESPNPSFFATFIYKNHGGAYLNLALTVTCALAAWYYLRGLRRLEKSNPAGLLVFFATCIGIAILVSYARGATIMMLAFLTACILGFVGHLLWAPNATRKPVIAVALVLLSAFFVKTGTQALRPHLALTRLAEGVTNQDYSLTMRQSATSASLEMLRDHWRTGAGAGSFQFLFPFYQQRYPELYATNGTRHFWEHAHNDVVQFAIELGAPGIALLLAGAAYLVLVLVRNYFWQNPLASLVTLGLVLLLVYAWWDFPFQCPAVLLLWCSLAVIAPMWARFEELHAKG